MQSCSYAWHADSGPHSQLFFGQVAEHAHGGGMLITGDALNEGVLYRHQEI